MLPTTRIDRVNILLVDDQPSKLLTYETILGELGENLIKVSSASEALQCLLDKEIAVVLNLSVYTVDAHRGRIMEKLNLHSINELVRFAVRNGLID